MASKTSLIKDTTADLKNLGENVSKREVEAIVNALFDTLAATLEKGENVQILGFGTFSVRDRAARKGRNPQTGEEIEIPAHKVVGFKAGSNLKAAVK